MDIPLPAYFHSSATENPRQWALVAVATACGYVAAYNIGKLPPSIPALRSEFATSLTWVAALVSSYSLIAMTCSLLMGGIVARLGVWRVVSIGLLLLVLGGATGASTRQFEILLLARVLEGLGYLGIAITMPALIGRICSIESRSIALGVWGTFVPGGITLCMLAAPGLASMGGWRTLWWVGALCATLMLILASVFIRPAAIELQKTRRQLRQPTESVFTRTTVLLSLCFAVYSMSFTGLATFLPTFWSETAGIPLGSATQWAAAVVAVNILGNLTGGWLNRYGVPLRSLLFCSVVIASIFGVLAYWQSMSIELQLGAACLFSFLGGIAPATLFTTAAALTETPAQNGLLVGLLFQGAGFGQVIGPLLVGALVDSTGDWSRVLLYFALCGVIGMFVIAFIPGKAEKR